MDGTRGNTWPARVPRGRYAADRSGFALVIVTLVMVVAAAVIGGSVTLGSNHLLVNRYHQRNDQLVVAADGGLEMVRARLNGEPALYPDSGYVTIESNAQVSDGAGGWLPGVRRSLYVGPMGIATGQFGVFGAVIAVATDAGGAKVVRRLMMNQESFAKFAYFTDIEPASISFGGGDQIFGPVHTNDFIKIYSSGATFHDETRTARTVQDPQFGVFEKGYQQNVSPIPMPPTAELTKLSSYAATGGTRFVGTSNGLDGQATTRIEFMAIDLNADGDQNDDNEGFIRVYQSNNAAWVSGDPTPSFITTKACGHYHAGHVFRSAFQHSSTISGGSDNDWLDTYASATRRCLLGGSDSITGAFRATDADGPGSWLLWGGAVSPLLNGRADKNYLFPISRSLNPNFKGVIYVQGKVILSGRLRGRVTVAATDDIIIGDDLTYVTDPGQSTCVDIMGFFSGDNVFVANNAINAPQQPNAATWYTLDDTKDEFIHGVVLALNQFRVEGHNTGSDANETCEGQVWGRGCLYLTGGIIQRERGPVGTITSNSPLRGTGYVKRYSYDPCAAQDPPPYFPTTGHFIRGQHYNMDPVGFNAGNFFAQWQNP
jgi:hypothetical protein